MPKVFTSKTQKTGEIGENVAVKFLLNKGFNILERNYTRKWGEIDIITEKGNILHFIEVKSVSRETLNANVSRETLFRPEENMHPIKIKKIFKTIETYLMEKSTEKEWQLDLVIVYIDIRGKRAKIRMLEDLVSA